MRKRFVILGVLVGVVVMSAVLWHIRFLRSSRPAVSIAIARAKQSTQVMDAIGGEPVRVGNVAGSVIGIGNADSGNADLAIGVAGPTGSGKLLEWAQNGYQGWHLCSLSFVDSTGREIVLIPDEDAKCERE